MKAKDTVMSEEEMLCCSLISKYPLAEVRNVIEETCKHQAEISFKAGEQFGYERGWALGREAGITEEANKEWLEVKDE